MKKQSNIAIMVMAAGTSSRMKAVKQLLPWGDSTFIGNALKNAKKSKAAKVLTVLGAYGHEIIPATDFSGTDYIHNPHWKMGLGNSIAYGTQHLLKQQHGYAGILVMLCDQPFIDDQYLNVLIHSFRNSEHSIVATKYGNRVGVPAIFAKVHYKALSALNSDFGARDIIKTNLKDVLSISADGKELDIDTKDEYEKVRRDLDSGD